MFTGSLTYRQGYISSAEVSGILISEFKKYYPVNFVVSPNWSLSHVLREDIVFRDEKYILHENFKDQENQTYFVVCIHTQYLNTGYKKQEGGEQNKKLPPTFYSSPN